MNTPITKRPFPCSFSFFKHSFAKAAKGLRLAGLVLFVAALPLYPLKAQLQPGDLVAVCGDSITEQRLYSTFIQQYLIACQPAKNLNAMQFGWGGERAGGFASRMQNDMLPFKPTVATTCYGMNDGGYAPVNDGTITAYKTSMLSIVKQMKEGGVRTIILGSPGIVDPASYKRPSSSPEEYNKTLKALADTAKDLAASEGVLYADVFTPMMEGTLKAEAALGANYKIAGDGVHPFPNGHLAMAYAFLKAMGCKGDIGSVSLDYSSGKAESDPDQKILSSANGLIEIESSRYPFCFTGKSDETGTKAMTAFIPFNEELNRYLLVVKNAPAKAKITWGTESHEYSAAQLAKGINLAADYDISPFAEPFAKVVAAVNEQQNFEQQGIKGLLHSLMDWNRLFPDQKPNLDVLAGLIYKKDADLRTASRASLLPVKHSIKIEPSS